MLLIDLGAGAGALAGGVGSCVALVDDCLQGADSRDDDARAIAAWVGAAGRRSRRARRHPADARHRRRSPSRPRAVDARPADRRRSRRCATATGGTVARLRGDGILLGGRVRAWPASLRDVLVVDAVRTPIGRFRGALAEVRPDDLGAVVIAELVRRAGADPAGIDDVYFGCANQAGEDNRNVARMSLLLAGLPVDRAGRDRQPAVRLGAAGGDRRRARDRRRRGRPGDRGRRRVDVARAAGDAQGARGVSARRRDRSRQHARLAVRQPAHGGAPRHARAGRDRRAGRGAARRHARGAGRVRARPASAAGRPRTPPGASPTSWCPVSMPGRRRGRRRMFDTDEHPRPETTAAELAALPPAFRKQNGTVTAGNSSGINDGAAAVLLASPEGLARLGGGAPAACALRRRRRVAGVEPKLMGLGPIPATQTGARARRHHRRRSGSDRAERGVRRPGDPVRARAGPRSRRASTSTAAPSRSATRWARRARAW